MKCILRSTQANSPDTILQDGKEEKLGWKLKLSADLDATKIVQMSANYTSRSVQIKPIKASFPYEIRLNGKQLTWEAESGKEANGKEGDFIDINLGEGKGHLQFKICFEDASNDDKACNNSSSCSASGNAIQRTKSTSPHPAGKVRPCCQHKKRM